MGITWYVVGVALLVGTVASKPLSDPEPRLVNSTSFIFADHEYYVEFIDSSWQAALTACTSLGFDGLVNFESEEEWEVVRGLLEGPGQHFWIDGINTGSNNWIWTHGALRGQPIPDWAPWKPGHPVNALTHRIAVEYFNEFVANWTTIPDSERHNFVCKRTLQDDVPVPCYQTNDLVLVLDSSASITAPNYEIAKDFVAKLALAYREHEDNRLGFVIFSYTASQIFDLVNGMSPAEMDSAIRAAVYESGNTNTGDGIMVGGNILLRNARDVPMNMVILTDGQSNNPGETKIAADWAVSNGIRTFAVGITNNINEQELEDITGGNLDSVFLTPDFDKLLDLLRPVSLRVCK